MGIKIGIFSVIAITAATIFCMIYENQRRYDDAPIYQVKQLNADGSVLKEFEIKGFCRFQSNLVKCDCKDGYIAISGRYEVKEVNKQ